MRFVFFVIPESGKISNSFVSSMSFTVEKVVKNFTRRLGKAKKVSFWRLKRKGMGSLEGFH